MDKETVKRWMRTTTLADRATVKAGVSIYTGQIFMISERGINVGTGFGVYFFKWANVLAIHPFKEKNELKKYTVLFYNRFACENQLWTIYEKNEFRAGREFYRKHNRKQYFDCIERIYEDAN